MSDYAIVNIDEVEDISAKFGMPEGMTARFPKRALGCEKVGVSHQSLAPNMRAPFGHKHADQEEIYVVLSGAGRMKLEDEIVEIRARDVIRVAPNAMRAFESGPDGLELLAVGGPLAEERDSELVPGWWAD
jgi:mannose-6-phosphate isomerase-like protein (cupin superfamily)